jgi:two-component system chemotaxis response regulator CheY
MLHELYQDMLRLKGHFVVGRAYNGKECLEILLSDQDNPGIDPDFILMDHRMPLKNGLDTTRVLLKKRPGLKIIFISADRSIHDEALAAGAVGFVTKPFNIQTFLNVIEDL